MRKTLAVLVAVAAMGVALASNLTVVFGDKNPQTVDSFTDSGRVLVVADGLARGLGVRVDGAAAQGRLLFRLGKRVSFSAPLTVRSGARYVVALDVAHGLGYMATLSADRSKLSVRYERKIVCEDFEFQEQAQLFFNASRNLSLNNPIERDPFRMDRDGDGRACESLPEQEK